MVEVRLYLNYQEPRLLRLLSVPSSSSSDIMARSVNNMVQRLYAFTALVSTVTAQSGGIQTGLQYGENWTPTIKDSDLVAANFPDVNITLRSPAFLNPETVPARFANGTEGPTDDIELGTKTPSADLSSSSLILLTRLLHPQSRSKA